MNFYRTRIFLGLALLLSLLFNACYLDNEEDLYQFVQPTNCVDIVATYSSHIVPLIQAHCQRCHNSGRQDGNVNLEGYSNLIPYANDGSLLGTTDHSAGFSVMPTSGIKIPVCEIEQLRLWIADGALNN